MGLCQHGRDDHHRDTNVRALLNDGNAVGENRQGEDGEDDETTEREHHTGEEGEKRVGEEEKAKGRK